jgi:dihydrofolate reductase
MYNRYNKQILNFQKENKMRKLIVQEMITIDGFFAGPNGEIDWHNVDDEYGEYAKNFLNSIDVLLFGRVTYQLMASYWPTASNDIAHKMNTIPKIVFSKTLKKVEWQNTRLVIEDVVEEIKNLKQQPGKDLAILGSADLASNLMNAGLIDEYQITVVPVVLGNGKPLFKDTHDRVTMKLLNSKTLRSGSVQLFYQPQG